MQLDKEQICQYQQNRDPYLMIDYVTEVVPGKKAEGYKDLNEDEWFFKVHWPKDPNMPGMLQIEALTQMSALSVLTLPGNQGEIMYLISADKLVFKKKVLPKKRFVIKTEVIKYQRGLLSCDAIGLVDDEKVCSAKLNLALSKEIKKYSIG